MTLLERLLNIIRRPADQRCENCRYFSDHRTDEDAPGEMNGYCAFDFVQGHTWNEYGGHWTHHAAWCRRWEGGAAIFARVEEQP